MRHLPILLCASALSAALSGEDFGALVQTARSTWPDKHHIGIICDYRTSQDQVMALARAAGDGARITVADTRREDLANAAAVLLSHQRADYVVLLPQDRVFRDGALGATLAIHRLASKGLPAVGTTPSALKQGAVFSVGEGTGGALLVTDRLIGTVDVILPQRMGASRAAVVLKEAGAAEIRVHAAR